MEAETQLREAEERYRSIFNATGEGLLIIDPADLIAEANPALCRMHGYARAELIGRHVSLLLAPDRLPHLETARRAIADHGVYQSQGTDRRQDGSLFPVEVHATLLDYNGRPHVLSIIRDVTERIQAYELLERRVAERTRELTTLLNISQDITSTLELHPLLSLILNRLRAIVEYALASVLVVDGAQLRVMYRQGSPTLDPEAAPSCACALIPHIWGQLSLGRPVIVDDVQADTQAAAELRAAAMRWSLPDVRAWLCLPLFVKDRVIGVIALASATPGLFSRREAALAQAIASQAAVAIENARLYGRAQDLAVIEERQRLARELHDSVSQALYGIALGAHTARAMLDRDPARAQAPIDYVLSLAEAALAEMRALIFDLRPEALQTEGLIGTLTRQAESLQARYGLTVTTDLGSEPEVSLAIKEALSGIGREALHNAVKHARASHVSVRLRGDAAAISLEVIDDGIGFDPAGDFQGHLGLHTMRERAARLGGSLEITSAPRQGTHLTARVPSVFSSG